MKSAGLWWAVVAPLVCMSVISAGQVMFKLASGAIDFRRPLGEPRGLLLLVLALALYGSATLLWVAALRYAPLSRLYPFMALSFVLTPLLGAVLLREPISPSYWAGAALIVAGIAVLGRA